MTVIEFPTRVRVAPDVSYRCRDAKRAALPTGYSEQWRRRVRYRRDLRRLIHSAPHMIADIGLTFDVALAESRKPFWRR